MEMFKLILLGSFLWVWGLGVGSFGAIQILICVFFGIPTTIKLQKKGLLQNGNKILLSYIPIVILWSGIILLSLFIIDRFLYEYRIWFYFGWFWPIIFDISQIGSNANNISDYINFNKKHFKCSEEDIMQVILR